MRRPPEADRVLMSTGATMAFPARAATIAVAQFGPVAWSAPLISHHVPPAWSAATTTATGAPDAALLGTTLLGTTLLGATLLDWADPDPDTRVLLIGSHTLPAMCALIRRGSVQVAAIHPTDRPETACADLAVITDVAGLTELASAIQRARRALVPLGTLVLRLTDATSGPDAAHATRLLLQHGFARVRTRLLEADLVMRAEVPLSGKLSCA